MNQSDSRNSDRGSVLETEGASCVGSESGRAEGGRADMELYYVGTEEGFVPKQPLVRLICLRMRRGSMGRPAGGR